MYKNLVLSNSGNYSLYIKVALSKRKRQRDWKEIDIMLLDNNFNLLFSYTKL
jgi:hypothetical protein